MGLQIQIDDKRVIDVLTDLSFVVSDLEPLFGEIGFNLVENARLRFDEGISPSGEYWVQSIRARETGGQTLRDKGILLNSITYNVLSDGVEYGTNVPYAAPNNYGAEIKPVNGKFLAFKLPNGKYIRKKSVTLPKREFIGISNEDEVMVVDIIGNFLSRVVQ